MIAIGYWKVKNSKFPAFDGILAIQGVCIKINFN
jgi:hypothetical protein